MHQLLDAPDGLFGQGRKVRLMSIFTANLDHGDFRQMTLEELTENRAEIEAEIRDTRRRAEKERKLQALSKTLQERFGAGTVRRGMKLAPKTETTAATATADGRPATVATPDAEAGSQANGPTTLAQETTGRNEFYD